MKTTLSSPLLTDNDNNAVFTASAANMGASHLRKLGIPGESIRAVFTNPGNSKSSSRFFVCSGNEGQGSCGASSASGNFFGKAPGDNCHRSGQVKHIDASSSPNTSFTDLACKGRMGPVFLINGDDIGVSKESQGLR
jgi:hypothetical protein